MDLRLPSAGPTDFRAFPWRSHRVGRQPTLRRTAQTTFILHYETGFEEIILLQSLISINSNKAPTKMPPRTPRPSKTTTWLSSEEESQDSPQRTSTVKRSARNKRFSS